MSKLQSLATPLLALAVWIFATGALAAQESAPSNGVPAHLLVTVEPHKGHEVPAISKDDVLVYQGHDRDTVTEWIPAQGDRAGLEVFILLDDASTSSLGVQLNDIRNFINAQPESTKIGVAYMQDGIARVVQAPTADHAAADKSLRLPLGQIGVNASPYFSLSDLVKRWPPSNDRREVFMVTDGIDRYYGLGDLNDPYLQQAIDDAGRAGIVVSALYNPDVGHFGHSYWQTYWGQLYLSELADKTGGEAYYIGMTGSPVAFAPYLQEFEQRTQHQYFLTFLAKPPKKAGWVEVRLRSEVPNVDLVSSRRVYISPEGR
jgi:hypothetical protein